MHLTSPDGASVEVRISGYEFPGYKVDSAEAASRYLRALAFQAEAGPPYSDADPKDLARDWDANWLQIRGNITLADGRTWAFEQPCLTTWDARELGDWLRGAAAGTVPPSPIGTGEADVRLEFLEPNLAFSLAEHSADRVGIRVHFDEETLPPWLEGAEEEAALCDYFVNLDMPAEELAQAAESWMQELAEFPER